MIIIQIKLTELTSFDFDYFRAVGTYSRAVLNRGQRLSGTVLIQVNAVF